LRPALVVPLAIVSVLAIAGSVIGGLVVGGQIVAEVNAGRQKPVQSTATPAPSGTDPASPASGTDPLAGITGTISLDDQVDLGGIFPVWGYPFQDGWEVLTFDQNGINQSQNADLGCLFTSSQNKQAAGDLAATDDLTDTLATVDALEQQLLASGNEAKLVGELGSTDFGVTLPGAEQRIEFLTTRVDYLNPEQGVSYTNEIAARAMPAAESFMYIVVSCPTSLVDSGASPFEQLRSGLAVVVSGPTG